MPATSAMAAARVVPLRESGKKKSGQSLSPASGLTLNVSAPALGSDTETGGLGGGGGASIHSGNATPTHGQGPRAPRSRLGARIAESVATMASTVTRRYKRDPSKYKGYVVPVESALAALKRDFKLLQNYAQLMSYLCFYATYIVVLFLQRDTQSAYNIQAGIAADLARTGYADVYDGESFYAWAKAGLVDYAYRSSQSYVSRFNRVIGGILILNYRVTPETCKGQPRFQQFYPTCYLGPSQTGPIDISTLTAAQQTALTPLARAMLNVPAAVSDAGVIAAFQTAAATGSLPIGTTFDEIFKGYMTVIIPEVSSREVSQLILSIGQLLKLVNESTNAIKVKFASYNGHHRSIAFTEMTFTFTAGGRVKTKVATEVIRVELYSMTADKVRLWLEISIAVVVCYWFVKWLYRLVRAVKRKRLSKDFSGLGVVSEIADLALYFAVIGLWVSFAYSTQTAVPTLKGSYTFTGEDYQSDLQTISTMFNLSEGYAARTRIYQLITAFNLFLGMIRLLKLLHFQGRMSILTRTLVRAGSDLSHFALLFSIVIVSYACMGQILYGHAVQDYSDTGTALVSLAKIMVSVREDYDQISDIDTTSTIFFFWTFVILIVYILVNMFLAIIIDTYSDVRDEATANSKSLASELLSVTNIHLREVLVRTAKILRLNAPVVSDRQVRELLKEMQGYAEDGVVGGRSFIEALKNKYAHLSDEFVYYCLERVGRPLDGADDGDDISDAGSRRESVAPSVGESTAAVLTEAKPSGSSAVSRFAAAAHKARTSSLASGGGGGGGGGLAPRKSVRKRLELFDVVKQMQNGGKDPAQLSSKQRIKELVASQRLAQERLARIEDSLQALVEGLGRRRGSKYDEEEEGEEKPAVAGRGRPAARSASGEQLQANAIMSWVTEEAIAPAAGEAAVAAAWSALGGSPAADVDGPPADGAEGPRAEGGLEELGSVHGSRSPSAGPHRATSNPFFGGGKAPAAL